jgi:hypothetical protein
VAHDIAGHWETERAKGTYTVLAFCEDQKGFLLHVTPEGDSHFGFKWEADENSIAVEWPEDRETWPYRRTVTGEHLQIQFPDADAETFHYFGQAESCTALTHRLTRLESPAAFSRWAWSLRAQDQGQVHSSFAEGAIFEICIVLIGCLFAGAALARTLPDSRSVMFGVALLPFACFAVFREHYKDSIQWWLLCPAVRRVGAFLYMAVGLLSVVATAMADFYAYPAWEAILRTMAFSVVVVLCGWTIFRELRGHGRPRFEIIGL